MKNSILPILILVAVAGGAYYYLTRTPVLEKIPATVTETATSTPTTVPVVDKTKTVIGTSTSGNTITAYHYGDGTDEILFVGGIHGGYEWNTALVAYELMDYLKANQNIIPKNITVTVIPVLNPDGLKKVTGTIDKFTKENVSTSSTVLVSGRFNANNVDLNRNFDCDWKAKAVWQTKPVSGGTAAFSEPESLAVKNYIEQNKPKAVVVWYSSAGGVFASSCHNGVLAETKTLTKIFGDASKYPQHESFDFYATTGDMVNWLAKNNIPAISVLLTNHTDTEWEKNLAGITALFKHYAK